MYGIIETEKDIDKLKDIVKDHTDFVVKPAQGAGGDGILVIADRFEGRYKTVSGKIMSHDEIEHQISNILTGLYSSGRPSRPCTDRVPRHTRPDLQEHQL